VSLRLGIARDTKTHTNHHTTTLPHHHTTTPNYTLTRLQNAVVHAQQDTHDISENSKHFIESITNFDRYKNTIEVAGLEPVLTETHVKLAIA